MYRLNVATKLYLGLRIGCWVVAVALVASVRAEISSVPNVQPGAPTASYEKIVKDLEEIRFVVITYLDGTKSTVSDPKWLDPLKRLLASADGKPDSFCFCINFPRVTFVGRDRELATMEVPHGEKFRFYGAHYSGDFRVDPKLAHLVLELLQLPHDRGIQPRKRGSGPPARSELPNPLPGVAPSIPGGK